MTSDRSESILEQTRSSFRQIADEAQMLGADVSVLGKPLTPEEAIGTPGRRDFPIILGKERVLEATVLGSRGQAFTDSAREYLGQLQDVVNLDLRTNEKRAIYVATLNAVLAHVGRVECTVHCRDDDPEDCGREIAETLFAESSEGRVGLIGLNPAIGENLVTAFGSDRVFFSDLDPDNVGRRRFGVEVWDGRHRTDELIDNSEVVVFTGTTLVNGTFDAIFSRIRDHGKRYLIYGMTAAGVGHFLDFRRVCPRARAGKPRRVP